MDWFVDANISEEYTVSNFRAEVVVLGIRETVWAGMKVSLKEWTSHDRVRYRLGSANGETPNRGERVHRMGFIPW